jgi:L-serine deaminase
MPKFGMDVGCQGESGSRSGTAKLPLAALNGTALDAGFSSWGWV